MPSNNSTMLASDNSCENVGRSSYLALSLTHSPAPLRSRALHPMHRRLLYPYLVIAIVVVVLLIFG